MRKVYLSGPMEGLPNDNAEAFNNYAQALRERGYRVFNPIESDTILRKKLDRQPLRREYFMQDAQWICEHADIIAMIPGWENSSGARAEWALAFAIRLEFIYLTPEYLHLT